MRNLRYTKALIITHGFSEDIFVKSLKSNLRLPIEVYPKYKRKTSIQINGLQSLFSQSNFKKANFLREYPSIHVSRQKLLGFKLFIIMDTDDVSRPHVLQDYLDKSLFNGTWLKEYIVPIYNTPDLDIVLNSIGYTIDKSKKRKSYQKVFPVKVGNYAEFKQIKVNFEKSCSSNMIEFLDYLDKIATK